MIIGDLDARVAARQLRQLFDIEAIFKRRGRVVASYENHEKLLFDPSPLHAAEKYYELLRSTALRRVVEVVANAQGVMTVSEVETQCSGLDSETVERCLAQSVEHGLLVQENGAYRASRPVGFGATFEWYVSALCVIELASISYWGVTVEELTGDYDVIILRENQIGYIECKSGKLGNITEKDVAEFLERERALAPQFSAFLVDGVSKERMEVLVGYALARRRHYEFEIPGVMTTGASLKRESYKNFVRLTPINSFFVPTEGALSTRLIEIYRFLTLVCDRSLPTENMAAKGLFRVEGNGAT